MAVVGFFNVAANILRPFKGAAHRINNYSLVYVNSTAFSTSLISGLILIVLSSGIRRRKQRAWNIAVIIDRKSTRLNSSHIPLSRMPSSA